MFQYNDGGRKQAGFKGKTGDCVTRAIAIAAELPYEQVYEVMTAGTRQERSPRGVRYNHSQARRKPLSARDGIHVKRKWFKEYMASLGFEWTPCMSIGSGCKVHVKASELPMGRLILSLSGHYAAFIDGVLHDTHDSARDGTRCVYGYWSKV